MTEPQRRSRFQFHLSTAIVMMFAAGGLMWSNTWERIDYRFEPNRYDIRIRYYGFPFQAYSQWVSSLPPLPPPFDQYQWYNGISWMAIIDLAIALIILFSVWCACERLIRLRASRKGA